MRHVLVLGLVLALVAPGVARAGVPPPPQGYSLVWSDDFSGAAGTAPGISSSRR